MTPPPAPAATGAGLTAKVPAGGGSVTPPAGGGSVTPPAGGSGTAPLRARWDALGARERLALGVAAGALALAAVWLPALQPALRTLREAPLERARLEAQWQTMQRQATEARELRSATPLAPGLAAQALQAATDRLGDAGRLSLQGERAVLTANGVDGPALMQWLGEARRGARAQPVEARLTRDGRGWSGTLVLAIGGGA
jgi:general secretion pathway protein M